MTHGSAPHAPPDLDERGAPRDGQPQRLARRLFMQLLAFECDWKPGVAELGTMLAESLDSEGVAAVIYEDLQNPRGLAVLSWSEDPNLFTGAVHPALARVGREFTLEPRPELTMIGRTYSSGFEDDLKFWLLDRPKETVCNPAWPWAVWYPLRRGGEFEKLEPREKGAIMREHATIGRSYGGADFAHDVRLACHGLDANDSEFVIGLVGKELYPLSHIVQAMRATRQTSEYITQMGPFFVGRVLRTVRGREASGR